METRQLCIHRDLLPGTWRFCQVLLIIFQADSINQEATKKLVGNRNIKSTGTSCPTSLKTKARLLDFDDVINAA